MNFLKELYKKRMNYLLKNALEMFSENSAAWTYAKNNPVKRIRELASELNKISDLSEADKKLDEIISICVVWKNSFVDWDAVEKEESKKRGWFG